MFNRSNCTDERRAPEPFAPFEAQQVPSAVPSGGGQPPAMGELPSVSVASSEGGQPPATEELPWVQGPSSAFNETGRRQSDTLRLTYAITPPTRAASEERRRAIASEHSVRIASLPIDALLVYDVQDEATRNGEPRPFPFLPKVEPLRYAFEELQLGELPRVVYKAIAGQEPASLVAWSEALRSHQGRAVFVGAPSRADAVGSLSLEGVFQLVRRCSADLDFGAVVIAERHRGSGTEDARVWAKRELGCSFFVSQTVWSVSRTKRLLRDLERRAEREGGELPPIVFTFSPCGSPQTLQFLEWLGVEIDTSVKRELLSAKDMLARSIDLAAELFEELWGFARELGLCVGCNVESVTSRAVEIDASIALLLRIDRLSSSDRCAVAEARRRAAVRLVPA